MTTYPFDTFSGQKAAEGMFPVCIEVEAEVENPEPKPLADVSVYGFIKEDDAGMTYQHI